ncbi:hypothetical protein HY839_01910 [Candidatus Azambacteria bacterium]|nr:hypothetical protein [Candidatus Azambacteria bacterium]
MLLERQIRKDLLQHHKTYGGKKMREIEAYKKTGNCYTGEVDGYGYALVPGSKRGVVLLDMRTKLLYRQSVPFSDRERFATDKTSA